MPKTKGAVSSGLLQANEFAGQHDLLRVWNIANVAINLAEMVGEGLVLSYLEQNLKPEDTDLFKSYTQAIHRGRTSFFGLFKGDSIKKAHIPRTLREAGIA